MLDFLSKELIRIQVGFLQSSSTHVLIMFFKYQMRQKSFPLACVVNRTATIERTSYVSRKPPTESTDLSFISPSLEGKLSQFCNPSYLCYVEQQPSKLPVYISSFKIRTDDHSDLTKCKWFSFQKGKWHSEET